MGQDEKDFPKVVKMGQLRILLSKKPADATPNPFDEEESLLNIWDDDYNTFFRRKEYINFYDMGLVFDEVGGLLDNPYCYSPSYTVANVPSGGGTAIIWRVPRFTSADWDSFYEYLIGTGPNSGWGRRFQRIPLSIYSPYNFSFNDSLISYDNITRPDGKWTYKGLKVTTAPTKIKIGASGTPYFGFDTSNTVTYKVTGSPDSSDDPVVIPKKKKYDIFLIPKIGLEVFSAYGTGPSHSMMDFNYRPIPRVGFPLFEEDIHGLMSGVHAGNAATAANEIDGLWSGFLSYFKGKDNVRASETLVSGSVAGPNSPIASSGFPPAGVSWFHGMLYQRQVSTDNPGGIFRAIEASEYPSDFGPLFFDTDGTTLRIVGIIQAASKFYYVWATESQIVGQLNNTLSIGSTNPFRLTFEGGTFNDA